MNELLQLVRDAMVSDRSDTAETGAFLASQARLYARNGASTCGECGATPEPQRLYTATMPCGHPWSALVWTPDEGAYR